MIGKDLKAHPVPTSQFLEGAVISEMREEDLMHFMELLLCGLWFWIRKGLFRPGKEKRIRKI